MKHPFPTCGWGMFPSTFAGRRDLLEASVSDQCRIPMWGASKTAAQKDDPKKSVTNLPETNSSIPKIWTIFSPNIPPKKRMDDGGEHLSPNFYRFLDGSFRRLPRVPGSLVLVRLKAAMKYRLNTWWLWRRQILGKHMAWVKKISQEKRKNRKKTIERTETPIEKPGLSLSKKFIFGTFVVFLMQI